MLDDHGASLAMPDCRVDTKVTWTDDTGDRSDDIHRSSEQITLQNFEVEESD